MQCLRCEGWMVPDRFMDLQDDTGQLNWEGWRCVNCGEILDPVVLSRRRNVRQPSSLSSWKSNRRWRKNLVWLAVTER